ncbi:hypothetical protein HPP92_016428 [Vanilla planifolia]|uniref:Uncharacterized protein n=1 Tax=Vanilla planifolia TaxID=51239 RepID=A0A835QQ95_VANPL|nr:hypothetical protein HPP92_016428 [Vanilla planifolia]
MKDTPPLTTARTRCSLERNVQMLPLKLRSKPDSCPSAVAEISNDDDPHGGGLRSASSKAFRVAVGVGEEGFRNAENIEEEREE